MKTPIWLLVLVIIVVLFLVVNQMHDTKSRDWKPAFFGGAGRTGHDK